MTVLPTISLCMIVRDEAESLPLCLESVKDVVDQIIVVDTGSTDGTVELAKQFGAEIYYFPWTDSFSEARNYSLDRACCDWILILDGDDELVAEDANALKALLVAGNAEAYYLQTLNLLGVERPETELRYPTLRLFRNRPSYRYTGRIHESVVPRIIGFAGKNAVQTAPVRVRHYGYLKRKVTSKNKAERNLALLQMEVAERGEDSFLLYNLGVEYLRLGNDTAALDYFIRAEAKINPNVAYAPSLVRKKTDCLNALGRRGEALSYLEKMIERYPGYTDLHYTLGMLYLDDKKCRQAVSAFERCLRQGEAPGRYLSEKGIATYLPCMALGNVYEYMMEPEKALQFYHRALSYNPGNLQPLQKIIRILLSIKSGEETLVYLDTWFNLANGMANKAVAAMLFQEGFPRQALPFINRAEKMGENGDDVQLLSGQCLLLSGDKTAAEEALKKIQPGSTHYLPAQQGLCLLYWMRGDYGRATECLGRWPADSGRKQYNAIHNYLSSDAGKCDEDALSEQKPLLSHLIDKCLCAGQHALVQKLLSVIPADDGLCLSVGKLLHRHGYQTEAETCIRKALSAGEKDSEGALLLADYYTGKHDWEQAKEYAVLALEWNSNPTAYVSLADIYRSRAKAVIEGLPEGKTLLSLLEPGKSPKLSLCMIVRDEETNLPRCLQSVRQAVDEIIVVDTGSVDSTVEIARQFGAAVFRIPWNGDFAEARNVSLRQATGDWILFLDADEELHPDDTAKLRGLLQSDTEGYCFHLLNYYGTKVSSDYMRDLACRLFRNREEYRFQRSLHEQVVDQIIAHKGTGAVKVADVRIRHYGYLAETMSRKNKTKRNLEIIKKALENNPGNPFLSYSMAVELLNSGDFSGALLLLQQAHQPGTSFASDVVLKKIVCLRELGRIPEAVSEAEQALTKYPDFTDLVFLTGQLLFEQTRFAEATACFHRCLSLGDASFHYCGTYGAGSFRAFFMLGKVNEAVAEWEQAIDSYKRAVQCNPSFHQPLYALARLLRREKSAGVVLNLLKKEFSFTTPAALLLLADVMMSTGDYESALQCFGSVIPDGEAMAARQCYMLGLCFSCLGRDYEAMSWWSKIPAASDYYLPAGTRRFLSALASNDSRSAESAVKSMAKVDAERSRTFAKIQRSFFSASTEHWNAVEREFLRELTEHCRTSGKAELAGRLTQMGAV